MDGVGAGRAVNKEAPVVFKAKRRCRQDQIGRIVSALRVKPTIFVVGFDRAVFECNDARVIRITFFVIDGVIGETNNVASNLTAQLDVKPGACSRIIGIARSSELVVDANEAALICRVVTRASAALIKRKLSLSTEMNETFALQTVNRLLIVFGLRFSTDKNFRLSLNI